MGVGLWRDRYCTSTAYYGLSLNAGNVGGSLYVNAFINGESEGQLAGQQQECCQHWKGGSGLVEIPSYILVGLALSRFLELSPLLLSSPESKRLPPATFVLQPLFISSSFSFLRLGRRVLLSLCFFLAGTCCLAGGFLQGALNPHLPLLCFSPPHQSGG